MRNLLEKFKLGAIFSIPSGAPNIAHATPTTPNGFRTVIVQPTHLGHSEGKRKIEDRISTFKPGASGDAHRNFSWLPYIPGFVSEIEQTTLPVVTGPLSGCPTTRYRRGGRTYVGHPGTSDDHDSADSIAARGFWNAFAQGLVVHERSGVNVLNDLLAMNLLLGRAPSVYGDGAFKCWAIVMPNGDFYGMAAYSQLDDTRRLRPTPVPQALAGNNAWWRVCVAPFKITDSVFPANGIMV